jgi:hypothetical protein
MSIAWAKYFSWLGVSAGRRAFAHLSERSEQSAEQGDRAGV